MRHESVQCSRISRVMCILWAIVAFLGSGCWRSGDGDLSRFSPSAGAARESLDKALAAWQRGEPPGRNVGSAPVVQVVDSTRQAGQTLASYEITDEVSAETPKRFSVRLKLNNPDGDVQVRYVVVG